MNLAVRDIRCHRGRFVQTCLGLGLLLAVVMSMGGIYRGLVADALAILEATGADVWVVQQGTSGPFAATSRMPEDLKYRIRAVPGVSQASPLSFQNIQLERFGEPFRFFLVGYEPGGLGGPPAIVEGRGIGQKHYELVADRAMGLAVGERLAIAGDVYTVVGLTRKMVSSSGDPVAWVTLEDAQKIQFKEDNNAIRNNRVRIADRVARKGLPPVQAEQASALAEELTGSTHIVNTVVARLAPGAEPARVRAGIDRWNHLRAISDEEQTTILTEGMIKKAKMQLGLFRAILLVISGVIISLIIYTSTLDKIRTIATLKLIGAKNRVIVGLILQQSILMGVIAYAIGYVLITLTQEKFPRRVELLATDLRMLFLIVVVICVAASMVGIRKALKVEAADALSS
ncbi:ABC transporter permease [Geobacter sulfurreducens]|uniref:ABC transporter, membrane protein, putative n=1 Tax=Geobacter sulfurreducens (strain ATCC 51573 / DSM 12127 / PCA) TaxID=243231 RepID=Q74EL4_GEOSL|nr:ABC transporter permease [Geobacter sulfurreducens]AAR34275.1 ABC transporter, membrane protein, putative [Geobacter sulfurreducens PCA]ADI83797.1 ABC transporter, membrane protein, putative [Geobacter sulfurreducens KN400]AJY70687.1 ABC transporter permease [Geobacter sulfurreducens]QVW36191.1 ABC transporter permease [Geobacter sulfurreducens]UAC05004.1 ABC transporter permease [Geobacter sulfurreducens]